MSVQLPTKPLNHGPKPVPILGFGTGTKWFLAKQQDNTFQDGLVKVLNTAIKSGFRHLDWSEQYGTTAELARAISDALASGIPRDELFISGKVEKSVGDIPAAIDRHLAELGIEYFDLYLIHEPYTVLKEDPTAIKAAWEAMEDVHRQGKARAIGVSNFMRKHIEPLLEVASVKPAVNQIEFHPYLQRADDYVPWLQSQGIVVESFFGLVPLTWAKGGPLDALLDRIAGKYGIETSAVLFQWALEQGAVPITTTTNEARITEYMQFMKLKLSKEEVEEISTVGKSHHFRTWWHEHFAADERT
ncbi:Aldo/keto reductase [Pseudovirgaria hyperparasitica]|uniref:Aldo/keto reductase n=1 Tax=Pseudovirgaria hyperparasitica TaxID=470096 RepID=A0A6A6VXA5_9PEZI|nr:Aldo/keto reductase [Pseudovirgaria hyperparasitica]KAF2754469.1 Aldo/keto reductase [Pseudovirgaria hyperparasitica]